jgi:lipid A ethanolaminephosphotransferase
VKPRLVNKSLVLAFGVALFLALTGNLAFFRALAALAPASSGADLGFLLISGLILVLALSLVLALFALPYLWKPAAIVLLLVAAVCAHFMDTYGAVIDRPMVQNIIETDVGEVGDLVTLSLALRVLALGVLPALLVARTPVVFSGWLREGVKRLTLVVACAVVIAGAIAANYKQFSLIGRGHSELRLLLNPTSPLYAAFSYWRMQPEPTVIAAIAEDATRASYAAERRPLLVVLVVGETARAANFSLGGYQRATNPRLAALPILYFDDVTSCGTNTAVSVPCMFSPYGRARYSDAKAKSHESLLDVLQRTGVSVLWRDNNSGCKSTCDRVPLQAGIELRHPAHCDGDDCFDEVLLEGLPGWIDGLQGDGLVVLHQQGSHGPAYYKRSPTAFKQFLPECDDAAVERCSRESIVNAYDNTILYTDFVLSQLIGLLEPAAGRFDVAMLYVSDHGESLGEGGLYLHGLPWLFAPSEQTHVPMLMWLSSDFGAERGIDRACLEQRRHESHSHDHLFHSVLGLFDIATRIYQPELDLFRPCRAPEPQMLSER